MDKPATSPATTSAGPVNWVKAHWVGLTLLAIVLAGAALRLFILNKAHFMADGDEDMTGLMAQQILQGQRPIFTLGIPYMGAAEAYFTAFLYYIFGQSAWAMKMGTFLAALGLIWLNYLIARRYFNSAVAGLLTATLTAFPSLYFTILELRAWNFETETPVLGDLLLLVSWALIWGSSTRPEAARFWGYTRREWLLWGALGLLAGVGFYGNLQTIFYDVPIIFFLFLKDKLFFVRPFVLIVLAGFMIGSIPFWIYNLAPSWQTITFYLNTPAYAGPIQLKLQTPNWETISFFLKGGGEKKSVPEVLQHYAQYSWPVAAGAYNYWFDTNRFFGLFLNATFLLAIVGWTVARWRGLLGWFRLSFKPSQPVDLLLLLVFCSPIIYVLWGAGNVAFTEIDTTGRYLWSLIAVLPVMLGGGLAALIRWIPAQLSRFKLKQAKAVALVLPLLVLVGVIGTNLVLYRHADFVASFQSPYFPELRPPLDNGPVISYLESQHIEYATCNHWVGLRITLESGQAVKCVDYADIAIGGAVRFPDFTANIQQPGLRVAFVILNLSDGAAPMEKRLQELGVQYTRQDFDPYIVIIPTSRPVSPREVIEQLHYPL